jgi:hypothetical protein
VIILGKKVNDAPVWERRKERNEIPARRPTKSPFGIADPKVSALVKINMA